MAGITEAIWQLRDSLRAKAARPSTSKAAATVSRVEPDGTVWVRLAGSDGETPITKPTTAEVAAGDSVTVEIGRGSSRLVGNSSTPAVGAAQVTTIVNPVAEIAAQAVTDAATAATAATEATESAAVAKAAADSANDNLKSVVSGAQTVEKAVSVMQTALEAVVDYDPTTDTTTEWFWHDADGAHVLGETSGYRNDIDSSGMHIVDVSDEEPVAEFGADAAIIGHGDVLKNITPKSQTGTAYDVGKATQSTMSLDGINVSTSVAFVEDDHETIHSSATYNDFDVSVKPTGGAFVSIGWPRTDGGDESLTISPHATSGTACTADGDCAVAHGVLCEASGDSSHASGMGAVAESDNQVAIGKYNTRDTSGTYALQIGKGTSNSNRRDALTVDWSGNVECGTVNGVDVTKMVSTTGTIAINNSPVSGSNSSLYWARFGNVVSGYFSCKLNGAISAWSYARLGSSGSLPAPASGISMYWPIMLDGNGSTQAAFNLGSTGIPYLHMRGGTGAVGNVFHGSFCYVCANGA